MSHRKLPLGEAAFKSLLRKYKIRAKQKTLEFSLSDSEFRFLVKSPCFYCGVAPAQRQRHKNSEFIYNGIDRKDNRQGYYLLNCVACCGTCNRFKRGCPYELFLERIFAISEHLKNSFEKAFFY